MGMMMRHNMSVGILIRGSLVHWYDQDIQCLEGIMIHLDKYYSLCRQIITSRSWFGVVLGLIKMMILLDYQG